MTPDPGVLFAMPKKDILRRMPCDWLISGILTTGFVDCRLPSVSPREVSVYESARISNLMEMTPGSLSYLNISVVHSAPHLLQI
jgi:hypothetical protein